MESTITKLRCTEETDFVILNYDQSDIEEIEECPEHLDVDSSTNCSKQYEDENTPTNSIKKDDSHLDEYEENKMIETIQGTENERIEKKQIHGSQSGLNYSDTEPVSSSFENCAQETCTLSPSGDNGLSGVGDEDDEDDVILYDDEDEINQIMDLTTIKRHRIYRHSPNSTAKLRLNLIVCFVITAGIFLGLGNYLGWSANWTKTKTMMTLNDNHIAKLKSLQDELAACINSQSKGDLTLQPRRRKKKDFEGEEVVEEKEPTEREILKLEVKEDEKEREVREIEERELKERELKERELKEKEEREQKEREIKDEEIRKEREQRDRGERRERRERREKKKKEDKDERKKDERKKEERKREERERKKKRRERERKEDL